MFNFLKKAFPELKKESNYYIQAVSDIIVRQHSTEPLEGQDVFVGEEFIGQINRMSSSFDPISSGYYRGFYLNPVSDHKKELIDGIYNKIKKAIDEEANARINGKDLAFVVNKELLKELNEKQKTIQKLTNVVVNEIKKYYTGLGAKTDDDIKQMFVDDIGKQLLARMEANIKSKEDSIKYTKEHFDIKNEKKNK